MSERFTATVQADALSHELAAALSLRPIRGARYRVTVEEVEESDEEKLSALRAGIQRGRDDIAAGRVIDGETLFAELRTEFFPDTIKP